MKQVDLEKGLKFCCLSSLLGESSCLHGICFTFLATQDAVGLRVWQTVLPCLLSCVSPLALTLWSDVLRSGVVKSFSALDVLCAPQNGTCVFYASSPEKNS